MTMTQVNVLLAIQSCLVAMCKVSCLMTLNCLVELAQVEEMPIPGVNSMTCRPLMIEGYIIGYRHSQIITTPVKRIFLCSLFVSIYQKLQILVNPFYIAWRKNKVSTCAMYPIKTRELITSKWKIIGK